MRERLTGRALGPDWRVSVHTGDELVLEQHRGNGWRRAGGSLVVAFGSLVLALALALATPQTARLITWPLSALLLVVCGVALPASLRNVQRARHGVRLAFTSQLVTGWPVSFAFFARSAATDQIARVQVLIFEHPPLSLALLEVVLRDGTRLAGPELAFEKPDEHPLGPVAEAIQALISADSKKT